MPRLRKLQDPAILQAFERGLVAGESINLALARLGVSRSTFEREMTRDDALRRRVEAALLAGQARPQMAIARDAPVPVPAAEVPAAEVPAAPGGYDSIASGAIGSGHVVFGPRRPQPLATVRRMAMRSAPRVAERNAPRRERLAVHDWLPALLLLIADVALAITASENFLVIAPFVVIAAAYVGFISWVSGPAPAAAPVSAGAALVAVPTRGRAATASGSVARPQADPTAAKGRTELEWVRDTIGEPVPGASPDPRTRHRPRD